VVVERLSKVLYLWNLSDKACGIRMVVIQYSWVLLHAYLNAPGSWHDSRISQEFFSKLTGMSHDSMIVADSAFQMSGPLQDRITAPLQDLALNSLSEDDLRDALRRNKIMCGIFQAAEWSMGSLRQGLGD